MQAIGDIILQHKPYVVALQEMTAQHWGACMRHPVFRTYHWSEPPHGSRYFTMLGCIQPFVHIPHRLPFRASNMGRDIVIGIVAPLDGDDELPWLAIGTSHLESLDQAKMRKAQIKEGLDELESIAIRSWKETHTVEDLVFCGDTNIDEQVDGQVVPPLPWQDVWSTAHSRDPGYTFDVKRNQMMAQQDVWARSHNARLRYDRFWARLSYYEVGRCELLGTERLQDVSEPVWPSDHFGLLLELELKKSGDDALPKSSPACPSSGCTASGCTTKAACLAM